MEKNYRHYWDDIKKSFLLYSLVPVLLLVFIGYPAVYLTFLHGLFRNNDESNARISGQISATMEQYTAIVNDLAELRELRTLLQGNPSVSPERAYEKIYGHLQRASIRPRCFVLDKNGIILLTTTALTPDYIREGLFPKIGIGQRMYKHPEDVIIERCAAQWGKNYSMCVGRAVVQNGQVAGFIVLDLPGESLGELMRENTSSNTVVTNSFGYLYAGAVSDAILSHNKLIEPLRTQNGRVKIGERIQYVSSTSLLDGQIYVYTIMDISHLDMLFIRTGILITVAELIYSALLVWISQRFARRKSKILDDMVSAVQKVGKGDLNAQLHVNSQDEFQIFAEEYNRMLTKLVELMQTNEEIIRQTVITEIKQLESQFNPHFLYNTLGTIRYMIPMNQQGAYQMIDDLSGILRYTIRTSEALNRLEEDLQYTQCYLEIQKCRFEDALNYDLHIQEEALNCLVPKLVIQPVIENAINYGFHSRTRLSIDVSVRIQEDLLTMVIRNDGEGMTRDRLTEVRSLLEQGSKAGRHIGLYNVHRRVQLLYGKEYGLKIDSAPEKGTIVTIEFPAKRGQTYV